MNGSFVFIAFTGSPVSYVDLAGVPILIGFGIAEFVLNMIVLSAMTLDVLDQDVSNYFIINLALADGLIGVVVVYNGLYTLLEWKDIHECLLRFGIVNGFNVASVLNIALLTIDKFIKIKYPFKYYHYITPNRAKVTTLIVWLFALTISVLPAAGWSNIGEEWSHCAFFDVMSRSYLITSILIYCVPFIVIVTLYPQMCSLARRHALAIQSQTRLYIHRKGTWRFVKPVGLIVGIYVICWLPVGTYLILVLADRKTVELSGVDMGTILAFSAGIGSLNSLFNPIIYAAKIPAVSRQFKRVCCCCCWRVPFIQSNAYSSMHVSTASIQTGISRHSSEQLDQC
ncbi:hypothetical protein SNE40_009976 [Patella caerulea]|uniref:G-protein coupled receptors family 1 profile domain-containing protein n=1 Tax=Patella caerulea TaxID=87958 RepID=A0AAN8Q3Y9_PATCE